MATDGGTDWPAVLTLPDAARALLSQWCLAEAPAEACGLLVGSVLKRLDREESRRITQVQVVRAVRAKNLERQHAHRRFELCPESFVEAYTDARADGLSIVGIWHSHPEGVAMPSRRDREGAWEGYSYLIVATQGDRVREVRSWSLSGARFVEQSVARHS